MQGAGHGGVGCECGLCGALKIKEYDWIMRLGTFYYPGGLNKRDKIKRKVRSGYLNVILCQYVIIFLWFMLGPACFLFPNQQLVC